MPSRLVPVVLLALLTSALVALPAPPHLPPVAEAAIHQVSGDELRRTVTALASDDMAGRGVGHAGNQQAEQYIATPFVPPAFRPRPVTISNPLRCTGRSWGRAHASPPRSAAIRRSRP